MFKYIKKSMQQYCIHNDTFLDAVKDRLKKLPILISKLSHKKPEIAITHFVVNYVFFQSMFKKGIEVVFKVKMYKNQKFSMQTSDFDIIF